MAEPEPETTPGPQDDVFTGLPRSDVFAALIRGLEGPDEPEDGKFVYTNCLDRTYDTTKQTIRSVRFAISRYAKYELTIRFRTPVTEETAIKQVEEFLSTPLSEDYYSIVKADTFHEADWEDAQRMFKCRGDVLTDCRFLEAVYVSPAGELSFGMGS